MRSDTGETDSIWMRLTELRRPPPLSRDAQVDVCVIGAGIAGVTTGYLLARQGKRVIVLDDGPVGGGETGRTTAHLASALDDRYHRLERLHGPQGAHLAAASHSAAIDFIVATIAEERIDCDFTRLAGYLFVPPGDSRDILDAELEAARRAGVAVEVVERAPLRFDTGPCLRFPRQGQFQPLMYLNALAGAIERLGGTIHGGTHVTGVEAGDPSRVSTSAGPSVTADIVVCATNTPIVDWLAIHSKQAPYRTFAIGARVPEKSVQPGLYWDTCDPYHYVRLYRDVLIVGGCDHKTGQADDAVARFASLEHWTRDRFPIGAVDYHWSGQVMEPVDGLGYIGRNPGDRGRVFIATGDSGQGMTHGTIAGMLIRDLVAGRANEWERLYDPTRKSVRSVAEYVKENVNAVSHYIEYVTPGEVGSEEEIRPGEGAILRHGRRKVAAYRDSAGALRILSAVCPHLGCIVHWNSLEKSWDCPCHGSRFAVDGHVLNGPAASGLEKVDERGR
jgi:glycine/D-amino acid oxidase-like deaminating enzyme/nitrite reductase/ring-hydroxylating ferredoxin subunit